MEDKDATAKESEDKQLRSVSQKRGCWDGIYDGIDLYFTIMIWNIEYYQIERPDRVKFDDTHPDQQAEGYEDALKVYKEAKLEQYMAFVRAKPPMLGNNPVHPLALVAWILFVIMHALPGMTHLGPIMVAYCWVGMIWLTGGSAFLLIPMLIMLSCVVCGFKWIKIISRSSAAGVNDPWDGEGLPSCLRRILCHNFHAPFDLGMHDNWTLMWIKILFSVIVGFSIIIFLSTVYAYAELLYSGTEYIMVFAIDWNSRQTMPYLAHTLCDTTSMLDFSNIIL